MHLSSHSHSWHTCSSVVIIGHNCLLIHETSHLTDGVHHRTLSLAFCGGALHTAGAQLIFKSEWNQLMFRLTSCLSIFFFLFLISIIFSIHTGFINQLFKQTFTNDLHVRLGDTNIKKIVSTLKELINLLSKREK